MYLSIRRRPILTLSTLILLTICYVIFHRNHRPLTTTSTSKIAKVSIAVNTLSSSDAISRCLKSHAVQNALHGYDHRILKRSTSIIEERPDPMKRPKGVWTKPAFMLHTLLSELLKPESDRLDWLFWFDADTLILNPHIRLETFLPPPSLPGTSSIHLILGHNWDGINDGAFLLRVHPWSVNLLTAHLSFPTYRSDDYLPMREQSALSYLIHAMPQFAGHWVPVPPRWFNSFPVNGTYSVDVHQRPLTNELFDDGDAYPSASPWKVVRGDMLVHFAGFFRQRDSWIPPWADRAERYLDDWSHPRYQAPLDREVNRFWEKWSADRAVEVPPEGTEEAEQYWKDATERFRVEYERKLVRNSDFEGLVINGGPDL